MAEKRYRATLSKGRTGWCVIFRHPVCKASDGRQALRVRRGLGTRDESEANRLKDQLNEILEDSTYWNPAAKAKAETKFHSRVVAAFFDHLTPERRDGWSIRESVLPLPGIEQGYATAQLVGPTGAGKTTLLRQLIGTDPKRERFPSISAARTTICDLEVILANGPYRAAVSFLSREQVRQNITECVVAAISASLEGSPKSEVVRRFMEHGEMRFRLSYILGTVLPGKIENENEYLEDEVEDEDEDAEETAEVTVEQREEFSKKLLEFLERVQVIASRSRRQVAHAAKDFDIDLSRASAKERDILQELVEEQLLDDDDFHSLVDAVLDEVEARFEHVSDGILEPGTDGWPQLWTHETDDRAAFIRSVNRFSSNYAPNFGRLLTPIVEGIRVAGPFAPQWHDGEVPQIVFLDGQGIGHIADSTSSISTTITRRFRLVDVILLVDNAAQPMQSAPVSALHSIVSSGHESKLAIVFTHFDEVTGDNLLDGKAKIDHVTGSFFNAVQAIGKSSGRDAEQSLKRLIPDRLFFLGKIQAVLSTTARLTHKQLGRLLSTILDSITPPPPVEYEPVYDVANLVLAIQKATQEFHDRWRGILGMASRAGVLPEHWTRVKALTRRIAVMSEDEYSNLTPVADLIRLLQSRVSIFLSDPLTWKPEPIPEGKDEERVQATDNIRKQVHTSLHDLARQRLLDDTLKEWVTAYHYRGTGSTKLRARDMLSIYETAAPVPNEMPDDDKIGFLFAVRKIVADSIDKGGGHVVGWTRDE